MFVSEFSVIVMLRIASLIISLIESVSSSSSLTQLFEFSSITSLLFIKTHGVAVSSLKSITGEALLDDATFDNFCTKLSIAPDITFPRTSHCGNPQSAVLTISVSYFFAVATGTGLISLLLLNVSIGGLLVI